MNDPDTPTDFELQVLREIVGEIPPSPWGAAIGVALAWLAGHGYITSKFNGELTEKGKALLHAQ